MPLRAGSRKAAEVLGGRGLHVVFALSMGLTAASACGGEVETRSERNIDVIGDASVGGSSKASGGTGTAIGEGGRAATGGARASGSAGSGGIGTSGAPGIGGLYVGGALGTGGAPNVGGIGPGAAPGTGGLESGGALGPGGVPDSGATDASRESGSPPIDAANATTTTDSARDASDATIVTPDGGPVCSSLTNCPPEFCQHACCPGGYECAICCAPRQCIWFDAAHCPLDRCLLLPTCKGTSVCRPPFSEPPPACGELTYYGGQAPCCSGLVLRCGALQSDGSCDLTTGGYGGSPMCIACGDGTCDTSYENRCNCPEDCP